MGFFSEETVSRLRVFFQKSGILYPKGKRAQVERRSDQDRRETGSVDYLAVDAEAEERRDNIDRRDSVERRDDKPAGSPLDGML